MDSFVGKVYGATALALLLFGIFAALTPALPMAGLVIAMIAMFVLGIAVVSTRGLVSLGLLAAEGVATGVLLGPSLHHVQAATPGLVGGAAVLTAILFGALTAYVFVSGKRFSFLGGGLFMALTALILASFAAMIFPIPQVLLAGIGVVIFSLYVLYDTSMVLEKGYADDEYAHAALQLFLDIVNLFLELLKILRAIVASEDS